MKLNKKNYDKVLFDKCLSNKDVIRGCKLADSTIYRLYAGKTSCEKKTAKKICDFLGVNPEDIFEEE